MSNIELKKVSQIDKIKAITLLRQGFEYEPTYRWCLCADEIPGYAQRLAKCMQADYEYHAQYGLIQGAWVDGHLVGVAYVQPPTMSEEGAHFPWMEILAECGNETLERVVSYMEEIANVKWDKRYYKLSFVAVDENCRGQGVGSRLLRWIDELVGRHLPVPLGVQLETSNPDNVRLYERHGYRVMQEKDFYGIHQYLMYKPPPTLE